MSKQGRKKKPKAKRKGQFADYNYSSLGSHRREGAKLRPPLSQFDKMAMSSWRDDHMPEMLWAVLLTLVLRRSDYLACFRAIAEVCAPWFLENADRAGEPEERANHEVINFTAVLDHTKLAQLTVEQFQTFVNIPLKHPLGYAALRPLLLVESLPGYERWKDALAVEPTNGDWQTLSQAIGEVLDHQSEKSTDIRWFKVVSPILADRMRFADHLQERVREILAFPDRGEMRSVRPSIRANEMSLRRNPPSEWIQAFWSELLAKTICLDPSDRSEYVLPQGTSIEEANLYGCRRAVIHRFLENLTPKRTDARLDSAFGFVLYALSLIEELLSKNQQHGILGRLGLRALVEVHITFCYLVLKDTPELWTSYRVYGAGQAKLAFLKAQELNGDLPRFLDEEALHAIANEDLWQEYLDIDVGHWAKSNLRELAIACGAKETYDRYYGWSSTYVHGQWCAVRDTNLITCHNPLHRLHRIPRVLHRSLTSMEADAIKLTNEMIQRLDTLYPSAEHLPQLTLERATAPPGA
jgi:hypothetical protein